VDNKLTLVIGASENEERYSNKAVKMLKAKKHDVIALGNKTGKIDDTPIETEKKPYENIDTITLYINAALQKDYYNYIFSLNPKRIIFNPGAENPELFNLALGKNIIPVEACTLVLLATQQY
jgi:uncharacterized protein